ncbi:unnamed protein product [Onchocerca ochengi]|uniref:ACB domain-containing protein n=1 Tax=Onchocerca ochengi TaxID=42157 RepID=A0A182EM03_ONCOC|nr:unnamed protein product [Onchocerca ochengi]
MVENLKDTVNCVASGKEQHITTTEVYEILQTKNKQSRWEHAFQFPSALRNLPNHSDFRKTNLDEKAELNAWIKLDCAETAIKLKKYITTFEEGTSVEQQFTASSKNIQKQVFVAANNDQCYSQSWLSSISPNSSMETSITTQD